MADVRLTTPRLRIVLGDDSEVTVQATNADLVRWDVTRAKHKWPAIKEAPFLWLTFVAWAALRRTKTVPDTVTYESFQETAQSIEDVTDPVGGADDVDPMSRDHEPI